MKKIISLWLLSASLAWSGVYVQGSKNFGLSVGSGSLSVARKTNVYTIVGVSANYFVVDNLSLGFGVRAWLGNSPSIQEVTVPVTYFIPLHETYRPYLGVFVRHTFVESPFDDYNSYGGRAGVAMKLSDNAYMSLGWVQEFHDKDVFGNNSSSGYPEITIGIAF